jgi:hypothetical protein
MIAHAAIGFLLAISTPALGQVWHRLYPQSTSQDDWFTGVAAVSADGLWLGGWQTTPNYVFRPRTLPTLWGTLDPTSRAGLLPREGSLNQFSSDANTCVGGSPSRVSWRCSVLADCADVLELATVWSCSDDGQVLLGYASVGGALMPCAVFADGSREYAPSVSLALIENCALSGDGAVAYFVARSTPNTEELFRWALSSGSPPSSIGLREAMERLVGVSHDGSIAYFSRENGLRRYTSGLGFEYVDGIGPGRLTCVTRNGRWGAGLRPSLDDSALGRPGFLWDPFRGSIDLSDLVSGIPTTLSRAVISLNGCTVAGAFYTGLQYPSSAGFVATLPCDAQGQGDYSLDGSIDQDDIAALVHLIAGGPNPFGLPLDFNHDGASDSSDVASLVHCVAGGHCP